VVWQSEEKQMEKSRAKKERREEQHIAGKE